MTKEDMLLFVTIRCSDLIGLEGVLDLIFLDKNFTKMTMVILPIGEKKRTFAQKSE